MLRRCFTLAFIFAMTLTAGAQQSPRSAPPPATRASSTSAPTAAEMPRAVRAVMTEKVKDLTSSDPLRVASAAYWLGELGGAAAIAVPQLTAVLADNRRVDAARYRKHLEQRSKGGEPSSPGEEAAAALAKIGEPAVDALIRVLNANPNPIARQNAAWALGIIQARHATGAVVTLGTNAEI